jgi:hypothetical protein
VFADAPYCVFAFWKLWFPQPEPGILGYRFPEGHVAIRLVLPDIRSGVAGLAYGPGSGVFCACLVGGYKLCWIENGQTCFCRVDKG